MDYLAAPYSHPSKVIRLSRVDAINQAAAILIEQGHYPLYSPISMTHPIAEELRKRNFERIDDYEFWVEDFDVAFLANCNQMFVLMLNGWDESRGIKREIELANYWRKPIIYLAPVFTRESLVALNFYKKLPDECRDVEFTNEFLSSPY